MANLWRTTYQQVTSVRLDPLADDTVTKDPSADPQAVWVDGDTGLVTQAVAVREFVRLLREQRDSKTIKQVRIAESDVPVPTFTDRTVAVLNQLGITPPATSTQ